MKPYDNFNPTIPDTDSPDVSDESAPVLSDFEVTNSEDRIKQSKKKRQKTVSSKMKESSDAVSIVKKVKDWAESQTVRWLLGLFLGFFGIYLCVAFISYFTSCIADQSEIWNTLTGTSGSIENNAGEGGARLSDFLINDCFGLGSFVIVFWLIAMSMKLLTGKPHFKSVNFTIKSLVALITVSLIVGLLTIGMESPVNWGGYHGRYVNEFVIHFLGWAGGAILCCFMIGVFIVICMRDLINWIIRIRHKRAEKKRLAREEEEERLAKERELEEMRRLEEKDAGVQVSSNVSDATGIESDNNGETQVVSFNEDEEGFYSKLPESEEFGGYSTVDESEYVLNEKGGDIDSEEEKRFMPPLGIYEIGDSNESDSNVQYDFEKKEEKELDGILTADENTNDVAHTADNEPAGGEGIEMAVNVNTISQTEGNRNKGNVSGILSYKFPPSDYLNPGNGTVSVDADEQLENREKIRKTLLDFGIPITSIEATVGPTVTLYEIRPDTGVKIAKIRNLADDIALALSAKGVRIIAPIPGRGMVGIEVANKDPQTVSMRTIIQSKAYVGSKYKLPIALGSTISNEVYIADLAKMPHLLVAGATGQGKSVGLNVIITSLLYSKRPDELKFVMVDPKRVEFSLYSKIENYYLAKIPDSNQPIITNMENVVATLSSLCVEMDDRYKLLEKAFVRQVSEYNEKFNAHKLNPTEGHRFMPYIVVIIDEFADLIMTAGKEVELPIARLAQLARAVGIHVIIATQRPSTNVITGMIKANFPVRIAFKVSSGVDSKTILDSTGAQQLIGRGDMLISNNGEMVRVQCALVDTPEVEEICDYIARQPYPQGAYILPEPKVGGETETSEIDQEILGKKDPLFNEVARQVVLSGVASTSQIQRRYRIGFNRAGSIMDQLEAQGIVGPATGGKPRSVLMDTITLESILEP